MKPLVFLDTETTGLHADRQPWEIAMLRRDDAGESRTVLYIDLADLDLDGAEPAGLRVSRFSSRHPQIVYGPIDLPAVHREREAAEIIRDWTMNATIVGVVPSFDTHCLRAMLARHQLMPGWDRTRRRRRIGRHACPRLRPHPGTGFDTAVSAVRSPPPRRRLPPHRSWRRALGDALV